MLGSTTLMPQPSSGSHVSNGNGPVPDCPDNYQFLSIIGSGSFGRICKVHRLSDGMVMARKEINYHRMNEKERQQLVQEVNILRELNHDHIVRYLSRYLDRDNHVINILMEYCEGGDLSILIKHHRQLGQPIQEYKIWIFYAQLVAALYECHYNFRIKRGQGGAVLHRDIKPDNVFLDKYENAKLGDFGLSTQMENRERDFASTYVGTPFYMSPELVQEQAYNDKSDIWSLGCLIYELCALRPPFHGQTHRELNEKILKVQYPDISDKQYSNALRTLIRRLLQIRPENRPSAKELYSEPSVQVILQVKNCCDKHIHQLTQQQQEIESRKLGLDQRETDFSARQDLIYRRESEVLEQKRLMEKDRENLIAERNELECRKKLVEASKCEMDTKIQQLEALKEQIMLEQSRLRHNKESIISQRFADIVGQPNVKTPSPRRVHRQLLDFTFSGTIPPYRSNSSPNHYNNLIPTAPVPSDVISTPAHQANYAQPAFPPPFKTPTTTLTHNNNGYPFGFTHNIQTTQYPLPMSLPRKTTAPVRSRQSLVQTDPHNQLQVSHYHDPSSSSEFPGIIHPRELRRKRSAVEAAQIPLGGDIHHQQQIRQEGHDSTSVINTVSIPSTPKYSSTSANGLVVPTNDSDNDVLSGIAHLSLRTPSRRTPITRGKRGTYSRSSKIPPSLSNSPMDVTMADVTTIVTGKGRSPERNKSPTPQNITKSRYTPVITTPTSFISTPSFDSVDPSFNKNRQGNNVNVVTFHPSIRPTSMIGNTS